MSPHPLRFSIAWFFFVCRISAVVLGEEQTAPTNQPVLVGVAKVDITPRRPVHLINELGPREMEGVAQQLYARAIAFGADKQSPAVLINFDGIGVPEHVTEAVARRLRKRFGIVREQVVVCATHTHWAPHLSKMLPSIYGQLLPADHQKRVDQYTRQLIFWLEEAATAALNDRRPSLLGWAVGKVGFAANRRLEKGGRLVTGERLMFTYNPHALVDHTLPLLYVHRANQHGRAGKLRAVLFSYACHNVALTLRELSGFRNQVHGDWVGLAQELIEKNHPGTVAIATIGCGGDQRPTPVGGLEVAEGHAREVAKEVDTLLADTAARRRIDHAPIGRLTRVALPLTKLPDRQTLREYVKASEAGSRNSKARGFLAAKMIELQSQGEKPAAAIPYDVQTWTFGDQLAMVFLAGEVVVDYGLRLRREMAGSRLWPIAYANATPCYIPSKRLLKRGGYEADQSMHYYGFLRRLTPETEDIIVDAVRKLLPPRFYAQAESSWPKPPKTPSEAMAAIRLPADLQIELVAAEPLVQDPVAFDFGPDGKLWVVEMRDYPAGRDGRGEPGGRLDLTDQTQPDRTELTMEGAPGGRIKVLDDVDGDGRFDRSRVFLDNLSYPTGIKVWRDGVLIACAPRILFAKDTTGDGRADKQETLYTGFGVANSQHRVSSFQWGLDNWLHVGVGHGSRTITSTKTGQSLELGSADLAIRLDSGEFHRRPGRTRFGHCSNDWGDWFGGGPQSGTWHYVLADLQARRNPFANYSTWRQNVTSPAEQVFPASKTPPRFNRPEFENHITSACGRMIYRDRRMGESFYGNLFICEPAHNLIHRRVLTPQGVSFSSRRAAHETESEFFASADNWSRPVMIRTGPEGALWIADMYRMVIEHPWDIPNETKRKLDLLAGCDRGRIYRICSRSQRLAGPAKWKQLDQQDVSGLVQALNSVNGWRRDMAQQMLIWRNDPTAAEPLMKMAKHGRHAAARLQALCTLAGLGRLPDELLMAALSDPHPAVRRHAIRLSEPRLSEPRLTPSRKATAHKSRVTSLLKAVCELADDTNEQVKLQLAFTLGASADRRSAVVLGRLLSDSSNPQMQRACLTAANRHIAVILRTVVSRTEHPSASTMSGLATTALGFGDRDAVNGVLNWLASAATKRRIPLRDRFLVLAALLEVDGMARLEQFAAASHLQSLTPIIDGARKTIANPRESIQNRRAAVRLLGYQPKREEKDLGALVGCLEIDEPSALQISSIQRLGRWGTDHAAEILLERIQRSFPHVREAVLDQLTSRPSWTKRLIDQAAKDPRLAAVIGPVHRRHIIAHKSPEIRAAGADVFGAVNQKRQSLVEKYLQQIAAENADAGAATDAQIGESIARGQKLFGEHCAVCHRFGQQGKPIAPDLATLTDRSTPRLVTAILDPNRAVADKFLSYTIETTDGRLLSGMIVDQSAAGLTLIGGKGETIQVRRDQIADVTSTGVSLMPEGIEQQVDPQKMSDLITYLQQGPRSPGRSR